MEYTLYLLLISVALQKVYCYSKCESKQSCHECIQDLQCDWCIDLNALSLCIPRDTRSLCKGTLISPKTEERTTQNDPMSSIKGKQVQMRPQKVSLTLRKDQEYKFEFEYKQAKNYPVDLYYLMDLSASMKEHKRKVANLGKTISDTVKTLTDNVTLGFGSFIDKPAFPFVDTSAIYQENDEIAKPYGYLNHLSLTPHHKKFTIAVEDAKLSENIDAPEGTLDALLQAIVCKKVIKWRSEARHLLVVATDERFHIEGDGKLAGILEPHDGNCHVINNEYKGSLLYDYPSVSQIKNAAMENSVILIFVIKRKTTTVDIFQHYRTLSEMIKPSYPILFDDDSSDIQNVIVDTYKNIVTSVIMTSNAPDIVTAFDSNCSKENKIKNGCSEVHNHETIKFTATIKPTTCFEGVKSISIKPEDVEESITIDLKVHCSCECESQRSPKYERNSKRCHQKGNLECGVCKCHTGSYGKNCECDGYSESSDIRECQATPNSTMCSGLGQCVCGNCECESEKIYGKYCQCNNFNCNKFNGVLCSGHGTCDCGDCKCEAGWIGEACECLSEAYCVAPGENQVCSGHGGCDCGACLCEENYVGQYCERCMTCASNRCDELQDCVECQAYNTGNSVNKCEHCNTVIVEEFDNSTEYQTCTLLDQYNCKRTFRYHELSGSHLLFQVQALKEKCFTNAYATIFEWGAIVIGTIILSGLIALLIWKILTMRKDQKEYVLFEEARKKARWQTDINPLYTQATRNYENPHYGRRRTLFATS